MKHLLTIAVLLLAAPFAAAEAQERDLETILIPVATTWEFDGAYGTKWQHQVFVFNDTDRRVDYRKAGCDLLIPECNALDWIMPRATNALLVSSQFENGPGAFIHVPESSASRLRFGSTLRETSGRATSPGTELPVVRESSFSSRVILVHPPLTGNVRTALRIYGLALQATSASIRVFDPSQAEPLVEMLATLTPAQALWDELPDHPGYFELDLLRTFPALAEGAAFRIEIDALSPEAKLWAFASVTNNVTQELTIVTPQ